MALLPEDLPTGLVTGQFLFVSEDKVDADTDPELTVVSGTITFTCSATQPLRVEGHDLILIPLVFKAKLNAEGFLVPANGTGLGVELPGSDSMMYNPHGFTWKVDFKLTEVGSLNQINLESFSIFVESGKTQSLADLMPVGTSGGTIIIKGPPGDASTVPGPVGPTPNIKIGTVITGTPNVIEGPKGDKGDPGGWVSTALTTQDLNTITIAGLNMQGTAANGTLARNYPFEGFAGSVEVLPTNGLTAKTQRATPYSGANVRRLFYERHQIDATSWTPWNAYTSTRTDETAGRAIYQWDEFNNRWQLVWGDTGWRNIASLLTGYVSGIIKARREMQTVTIAIENLILDTPAIGKAYDLDLSTGSFALSELLAYLPLGGYQAGASHTFEAGYAGQHKIRLGSLTAGGYASGFVKFNVRGSWPTTLPGVASGVIPSS